jgi:hypothetical protein
MKKVFFLAVFTLLSVNAFSQFLATEWVSTSERRYKCRIWFKGNGSNGRFEEWVSAYVSSYTPLDKPSNGQLECVRRMLSRYQTNSGDVFSIFVEWENIPGNKYSSWRTVMFVLEFTSSTKYRYRAFIYN